MSALAGDLVITTVADRLTLLAADLDAPEIELDLGEVDEIDCAGVQLVVLAWVESVRREVPFRVVAATEVVHEALAVVGMRIDATGTLARAATGATR